MRINVGKSVLFFGKKDDFYTDRAIELTRTAFSGVEVFLGKRGCSFPEDICFWKGDFIISYLSPWIIPSGLLARAEIAAINFHPGPPNYPGIGCTNFALYNGESEYGVTCHHMAPRVDTGGIICVKRFPIYERDSVWTLTQRCHAHLFAMFQDIIADIVSSKLPESQEIWTREPYKRSELNALCRITPEMTHIEMERRIRAVTFPKADGAFIEMHGRKFRLE